MSSTFRTLSCLPVLFVLVGGACMETSPPDDPSSLALVGHVGQHEASLVPY